jgi:hypothetical protein
MSQLPGDRPAKRHHPTAGRREIGSVIVPRGSGSPASMTSPLPPASAPLPPAPAPLPPASVESSAGHAPTGSVDGGTPTERVAGQAPGRYRPLGGYAALLSTFTALASGFGAWFRASGRELPEFMPGRDLALLTVATHKAARMITRDRVTSVVRAPFTRFQRDAGRGEVDEQARGTGLRRAVGELLVCPYCVGMWVSAGLTASLLVFPRFTRWFCAVLVTFFGSELLQIAYARAETLLSD